MVSRIEGVAGEALPGAQPSSLDFDPGEYATRYARASTLMEELRIDALVIAQPANLSYFTGLRTWFWALPPVVPIVAILPRDPGDATILDTVTELGGLQETTWIPEPVVYGATDDPLDLLRAALEHRGLGSATLGLELSGRPHLTPATFDRLRGLLPLARTVDATPLIQAVRSLKSDAELGRLREATRVAQVGFEAVYEAIKVGTTEVELTGVAASAMVDAGASVAFDPMILIFVSGPDRYRQPLQPSTQRPLREGELISLDGGCVVDGYHADFARAAVIGDLPAVADELLTVTELALDAAINAIAPGAPIGDAWAAAQRVLLEAGVGDAAVNPTSIGHGIGLEHWELPLVAPHATVSGEVRIRPGMTFCIEPQIAGAHGDAHWRNGLFLVEDQLVVTSTGAEVLTDQLPRSIHHAGVLS
jgi:Xaa-Pro dipeptidase